ncbi:MAG: histidinol-phosphate transaminase [Candidatus Hydrogenedentes bacterium]|nr:histidinol-phosphate transaminase [Candidatus Hydrogenedentota bacterium]
MKYGREILKGVEGYVPGEQPKMKNIIKLNTNENPYPPSPRVLQAVQEISTEWLRKYPDPVSLRLREAIAEHYGVAGPECVIAGNGMDDILAMAIRAFADPGDEILSPYPSYTLYETLANLHGSKMRYVDLDGEYQLPEQFYETKARMCFIPRPNAPSGVASGQKAMERLCREFNGLVFIDEAYADFADDNCLGFPRVFENAIIGRTFSKSYALCGLRLGFAIARPEIINELMKVKDSYNVNIVAQLGGVAALEDREHFKNTVSKIRNNRAWLTQALRDMGFRVLDSQTNFVLAHWKGAPSAKEIFEALRARAIIVRYFNARRLENAMRITVGNEREIEALIDALRAILSGEPMPPPDDAAATAVLV